ncbi:protein DETOXIFICATION 27 isoform X2 [Cryptomeria japonica]|nr:protein DETOXIFICATION 27 isoform X2 [Cryptomeria japonica]
MGTALGTLCGQAYGAQRQEILGIYMQRSWIILSSSTVALTPFYFFTTPILKLCGQPDDIAKLSGKVSLWCIPMLFCFVLFFTLNRFLQSQSKNFVTAWSSALGVVFNVLSCWLFVSKWSMGLEGALISLNVGWWTPVIVQYVYVTCGWCPDAWTGYSMEAFEDIWPFLKLSVASGVMIWLEIWYYRLLVLLTGNIKDVEVAVDSLSICLNINSWEMAIPLGFLASISVRVANELGAGRPEEAKFAVIVSVINSTIIGLVLLVLILALRSDLAQVFTDTIIIQKAVYKLLILLAFTILLNSIQPVLLGVAVGLGWQAFVAYINIGCYYIIGVPLGMILGYLFNFGVTGIWLGMICGTGVQTLALMFITWRVDWDMEAKNIENKLKKWSSVKPQNEKNNHGVANLEDGAVEQSR